MKVLEPEEEQEYSDFMDSVSVNIFKESLAHIRELNKKDIDATQNVDEIGMAMGQTVLDFIIEETKNKSREQLMKLFAEITIAHCISVMERNPVYKLKIASKLGLL